MNPSASATRPRTLILRSAGTNCDVETAHAFELAGAQTQSIHVNRLVHEPELLDEYQILAIPGGFSYGDDIAAGRILANQIAHHLGPALRRFVETGRPVIGICNGFQVLVKTDLLPGAMGDATGQTCTLAHNDCGRFVDRWVRLAPRPSKCVWTRQLSSDASANEQYDTFELPVAHGEGKFVPRSEAVRRALWDNGQVALVYATSSGSAAGGVFPANPNGSVDDIAGICDASGLVLGLMPHPERYVDPVQHPEWTRQRQSGSLPEEGRGLAFFRSAVLYVTDALGAGLDRRF